MDDHMEGRMDKDLFDRINAHHEYTPTALVDETLIRDIEITASIRNLTQLDFEPHEQAAIYLLLANDIEVVTDKAYDLMMGLDKSVNPIEHQKGLDDALGLYGRAQYAYQVLANIIGPAYCNPELTNIRVPAVMEELDRRMAVFKELYDETLEHPQTFQLRAKLRSVSERLSTSTDDKMYQKAIAIRDELAEKVAQIDYTNGILRRMGGN